MNVTASNRKELLDDDLMKLIEKSCDIANNSPNSIRYGRKFTLESRIDEYTIQLRLQSRNAIIATRTMSSITRALLRIADSDKLAPLKYNGSILSATIAEEFEEGVNKYNNLDPHEIVQAVVEIFFGQATMGNKDKKSAQEAAEKIKDIVCVYKNEVNK